MRAIGSLRTIKDQDLAKSLWMSTNLFGAAAVMSFFPPGLTASSVATYACEASARMVSGHPFHCRQNMSSSADRMPTQEQITHHVYSY
jgi:hypothetical protein